MHVHMGMCMYKHTLILDILPQAFESDLNHSSNLIKFPLKIENCIMPQTSTSEC